MRLAMIGTAFAFAIIAIGAKAVHLQVVCGSWLSSEATRQYKRSITAVEKRGSILDANLDEMALTSEGISIGAHPGKISDLSKTAGSLSKALSLNRKTLARQLSKKKSFVWVKRQASPREADRVKTLHLAGVVFVSEPIRSYPNRATAAQVIGFSGIDGKGLEGVEFYYDQDLGGGKSEFDIVTDAQGRRFGAEKKRGLTASGNTVILTIDKNIQYVTEKALESAVTDFRAKSGVAVVMDPQSGAVLSMAHFPFFNPNIYKQFARDRWRNRAITDPFEPGSTMKIFTAAAALESKACSAASIFFCENGAYKIGKNTIHDTHKHDWLSLQQIVKFSSNIGAVKVMEAMGSETLYRHLRAFGFGSKTGIDLPGETSGSLTSHKQWSPIDAGTIAFGQGIATSAIQLTNAMCAIANGGILMKPYVAQAVMDSNGQIIKRTEPRGIQRVVSGETADALKRILSTVITEGGTGQKAAVEGYTVCGKTGTAQKVGPDGRYSKEKFVSSFMGFAPLERPRVAVLVLVDEPTVKRYGGTVAAPAFKEIVIKTLDYLDVAPTETADHLTAHLERRGAGA